MDAIHFDAYVYKYVLIYDLPVNYESCKNELYLIQLPLIIKKFICQYDALNVFASSSVISITNYSLLISIFPLLLIVLIIVE